MREGICRRGLSSWRSRRWLSLALVLASALGGCGGVAAQEQPSTTTATPTSDWVMLERTRWDALTTLALTLEARLTERVEQAKTLQDQLDGSRQSIATLTSESEALQRELSETRSSRDNWQTSLEQERILWTAERLELVDQRDRARNQRDTVARRAAVLERSNRRNRMAWMVGIPVAAAAGVVGGLLYENSN
jgi:predicted outer membrane lipoprotein